MSGEFDRDANGHHDSAPGSPMLENARPGTSGGASNGGGAVYDKRVEDVMYSDVGINTLLNRLKQSIASARDFAQFLKKRSTLEEDQAKGLKRLTQTQLESVRRADVRGGTYAQQLTEVLRVHEKMADNGMQFALSLHQMHEDLDVLSANMERGRKQGKHDGLAAEKNASDLEAAMLKAKAKYEGFAEDYDKARTGDTRAGRRLGIKGPKSAEQHEQDLLRKTQAAEAEYRAKVDEARVAREELVNTQRPRFVKELEKYIKECDSALTLQLQKFATFNEKLLLGNGLLVQPLSDASNLQRSLRDLVLDIDNERDFNSNIGAEHHKIPPRNHELVFEKSRVLESKTTQPVRQPTLTPQTPAASAPALSVNTASSQPGSTNSRSGGPPQSSFAGPSSSFAGPTSGAPFSNSPVTSSAAVPPSDPFRAGSPPYAPGSSSSPYNPSSAPLRDTYGSTPPYPTHPSERAAPSYNGNTPIQSTGVIASSPIPNSGSPFQSSPAVHSGSPRNRVFGVSMDELFTRDQSAVPIIVFQCIQAVDMFGLEIEGIYRQTGNMAQVNRLRQAFDSLPPNDPQLDFRNPSNFGHDVNAVTSLMKTFFRELPDPLFTKDTYANFIESAQVDGNDARRDALHQCINDLPDANYATMRALVLHLHRVMQNEARTRMTAANLAVCLAPTLMGAHQGPRIQDASWQQRVLETILSNATAIFDED
ncbi:putative Rho GTPase activation protein [Septoria linicola]|nr:putative Rho GTPase activation protein [Septoria linicola]